MKKRARPGRIHLADGCGTQRGRAGWAGSLGPLLKGCEHPAMDVRPLCGG